MANSSNGYNSSLLDAEDMGLTADSSDSSTAAPSAQPQETTEDMALWMGLEVESNNKGHDDLLATTGDAVEEEGEDELDNGRVDEAGKTKTPLWSNPIMKLLFVAGVAGACLLIVGIVVSAIQSAGLTDLGGFNAPDADAEVAEEEPPADPLAAALESREAEIGQLKTQNAIGNQQLAMEIQSEGGSEVSAAELLALRNQIEQRRQLEASAAQAGRQPGQQPPTTTSPQAVSPRPTPAPAARPAPTPAPAPSRAAPAPAARPVPVEPEILPQEQLALLAGYGSYGSGGALPANTIAAVAIGNPTAGPTAAVEPQTAAPQVEPSEAIPSFSAATPAPESVSPESVAAVPGFAAAPKQSDLTLAQEEAAILGQTLVTVQPGTYAQAMLETPIYWAQDLADEQQSQRTALTLSEPLYGSRGEVALDAGTMLVAEVNVIAGSGLLQLYVTDVVVMKDGQQQVMSIPQQNLVITGTQGQPLVAREIQNEREIRSAQFQLAALGALGNVGELLNRPDSQQTTIGLTGSATSVNNGPVNILGGLLAGAADAVLGIEQSRVEGRIDDYDSQPRIWFHDANAPVMLFVSEEFTFQAN